MRYYIWDVRWSRRFVSAVLVHMSEKVWRITWLYNASLIRRLLKSIRTDLSEFLYIEKWNTISQNYKAWVKMNSFLKINVGNLLHNSIIFFLVNPPFSLYMHTPNKNFCRSQDVGISVDNLQLYITSHCVMRTKRCNPLTRERMPRKMSTELHVMNVLSNFDIKIV